MNWTYLYGNWVLRPPNPMGLVHFLGGAFVATAPQITYHSFLKRLAEDGFCVLATPFLVQLDHNAIAEEVTNTFRRGYQALNQVQNLKDLPVFGIGHSLGSKLQLLLTCQNKLPRAGNILISFNNFDSDRAIPFAEALTSLIPLSFSPSPEETLLQIQTEYHQPQTLVLRFQTDTLDESSRLNPILSSKFPDTFMHQILSGDHLTPLEPEIGLSTNRLRLEQVTLKWLNYQRQIDGR